MINFTRCEKIICKLKFHIPTDVTPNDRSYVYTSSFKIKLIESISNNMNVNVIIEFPFHQYKIQRFYK